MKKLKWDSIFFEKDIYTFDSLWEIKKYEIKKNEIIQKKISKRDINYEENLLKEGFEFIEGEITFFKNLNSNSKINEILKKTELEDLENIKEIIKNSYKYSRFNKIDINKVDIFYCKWVENSILGKFDDICLSIKENQEILGFITIKFLDQTSARIGLIGVNKKFRSKGIGSKLLMGAEKYVIEKKIKRIYVSTQSSNEIAIKFYEKNLFQIKKEEKWFYKKGGE